MAGFMVSIIGAEVRKQKLTIGSIKKYDQARVKRVARKKAYKHSPTRPKNTGFRYLNERELDQWYARLDQCMGKKMKVMR